MESFFTFDFSCFRGKKGKQIEENNFHASKTVLYLSFFLLINYCLHPYHQSKEDIPAMSSDTFPFTYSSSFFQSNSCHCMLSDILCSTSVTLLDKHVTMEFRELWPSRKNVKNTVMMKQGWLRAVHWANWPAVNMTLPGCLTSQRIFFQTRNDQKQF